MRPSLMKAFRWTVPLAATVCLAYVPYVLAAGAGAPAQLAPADVQAIEKAIGAKGTMQPGDVLKFSFPRADLKVAIDGVTIKPALALGTWLAFKKADSGTVVMGDLVLTEAQVPDVMTALEKGGVSVTALHNHLMNEAPRVMYMHVAGSGDAVRLAGTLAAVVSRTPAAPPSAAAQELDLDTTALDAAMGYMGKASGGVWQYAIPRSEKIEDMGIEIPPAMGTATSVNFQPLGKGRTAIAGDFVLMSDEVDAVIGALRESGIDITALHSHMLTEEPRIFYMHFWATGDATKLAVGLRKAADKTL